MNKNTILIVVAILLILITGALVFSNSQGKSFSFLNFSRSPEKIAKLAVDYLNNNVLEESRKATLVSFSRESGMVKFVISISGTNYDSYVTTDGKLFFPDPPLVIDGSSDSADKPADIGSVAKVSVDDDAVLGSKDAPVTMIEFSDYECPFCKRHFEQVYPEIKKNYIDKGKVKLVFRDFVAVQGHNPLATLEAMAAECAREQGGDSIYFKYHDQIFKKTTSNGNGMAVSQLGVIAGDLGLNVPAFQSCLDSEKHKEEFNKDNSYALSVLPKNDAGTPSFFIGKSSADGIIDGKLIKGALPYSTFQATIDALLESK